MARLGSPALDLSYFFLTSTHKSLRDKHYLELLNVYYNSVRETINLCGSDSDKLFTFDNLQEQLQKFGRHGLTYAIPLIEITSCDDVGDMSAYADDVAKNGAKNNYFVKFNDRTRAFFAKRMSDAIRDSIAYGWIESPTLI